MSAGSMKPALLAGVGNAGTVVLDLLSAEHPAVRGLLLVNGDPESLASSLVSDRLVIPEGDPSEGFLAIEEEFGRKAAESSSVILCGALGGVTGSFLLPALAVRAKAAGMTTLSCVGMPFGFEGKQRREKAADALARLHDVCDAVVVIDNDLLSGGARATAAVGEAFRDADRTLLAALLALRGMMTSSGPVRITRADLHAVLGIPGATVHFGHGSAAGPNRLHEAVERALKSPLFASARRDNAFGSGRPILLYLRGPKDLSFAEVQAAVAEIERIAGGECQIRTAVAAETAADAPLEVCVTASSGGNARPAPAAPGKKPPAREVRKPESAAPPAKASRATKSHDPKTTQGVLNLDSYQRGRFDKSEPTIVAGEDLDIPTFLRKGIKLGQKTSPEIT